MMTLPEDHYKFRRAHLSELEVLHLIEFETVRYRILRNEP